MFQCIRWIFVTALVLASAAEASEVCVENVRLTLKQRIEILRQQGQVGLAEDFLYADPRFRNFPALNWQWQIQYCPHFETYELVLDFLREVGFNETRVDNYFKSLIYLSDNEKLNRELGVRRYQIGLNWNRQKLTPELLTSPSLKVLFEAYGTAVYERDSKIYHNSVIYFGRKADQDVIAIPYHQLTQEQGANQKERLQCEDFKYIFPAVRENPVLATRTLLVLPEVDLAFCAIDLSGKTSRLKSPPIQWERTLTFGTEMVTLGRGREQNPQLEIQFDDSAECRSLAPEEEAELFAGFGYPSSWRLPMGCDVSPGDSGAALIDKQTLHLQGFVTSTRRGTFAKRAADLMAGLLPADVRLRESSHMVPLSKIRSALLRKQIEGGVEEAALIEAILQP